MYRGKKTLFYNGEILWEGGIDFYRSLVYDQEERRSWQVIIVLPGVEVIPEYNFYACFNVKKVIMADTVKRIEDHAFFQCFGIEFVKLSQNLEFIGEWAFQRCESLTSIFIPPSCREICNKAFWGCRKLIIFHVPQHTELGECVIARTALVEASPFTTDEYGIYHSNHEEVNEWIKDINFGGKDKYVLHRACSSFNPLEEIIYAIVRQHGLSSFQKKNRIGVTPSEYLDVNPFSEIKEQKIVNRYVLEMMGEVIVNVISFLYKLELNPSNKSAKGFTIKIQDIMVILDVEFVLSMNRIYERKR